MLDEDENLLEAVEVSIEGMDYSAVVITDEYGYYEFSGLVAGDYTLTYTKDGYGRKAMRKA